MPDIWGHEPLGPPAMRALIIATQYLTCNLTNRHIEIRGNSLELSGVTTTKVE